MLVYPSLHYQNGGIEIDEKCETNIPGLYVAGEATGGAHGRNRLVGNSVLDYNVFFSSYPFMVFVSHLHFLLTFRRNLIYCIRFSRKRNLYFNLGADKIIF